MGDQPYRDEAEEPRDIAGEWADLVCDFHDDVSDACSDNPDLAANYVTLLEAALATVTAERDALRSSKCEACLETIRRYAALRDERDTARGRVKWLEDIIGADESDVRRQLDTARAALAALRAAAKALVTLSESMRLLGDEFDEWAEYKQAESALKALAENGGERG